MLLSKTEREFLENPQSFKGDYHYILEHRIKKKLSQFASLEYPLIREKLTEFSKLTENSNPQNPKSNPITTNLGMNGKPMAGSEPTTFRLQGECSSQAELHWHEVK